MQNRCPGHDKLSRCSSRTTHEPNEFGVGMLPFFASRMRLFGLCQRLTVFQAKPHGSSPLAGFRMASAKSRSQFCFYCPVETCKSLSSLMV